MKIKQLTRRDFVASLAAATVLPACGSSSDGGANGSGGAAGAAGAAGAGGTGGSGGTGGTFAPGPEPASAWLPTGSEDSMAFAWGVQTGDALPTAILVSMRSLETTVTLTVMRGTDAGWEEVSSGDSFTADDGVVSLELEDLEPDTTYSIAFFAVDGSRRSRVARFRTAIPAGESRMVRFGATSCLGGANRPWPSLSQASASKYDFFLLLGDTIYADGFPTGGIVEAWKGALSTPGLCDVTASTSIIATWDDHEVDNNWSFAGLDPGRFDEALMRFRQGLPQRVGPGGTGIWRKLSWGSVVDVFVLDCRGERRDGNYISPEQMSWLKDALVESTATFKIVMNSVPITDFEEFAGSLLAEDRWQGFPAQRTELVSHVRNAGITGLLWVAGDFHIGGVGQIDPDGSPGDNQFEILAGPGGSAVAPFEALLPTSSPRLPAVVSAWNYVSFDADPVAGTLRARFIADDGSVIDDLMMQVT